MSVEKITDSKNQTYICRIRAPIPTRIRNDQNFLALFGNAQMKQGKIIFFPLLSFSFINISYIYYSQDIYYLFHENCFTGFRRKVGSCWLPEKLPKSQNLSFTYMYMISRRRYIVQILPIRHKTQNNQSNI